MPLRSWLHPESLHPRHVLEVATRRLVYRRRLPVPFQEAKILVSPSGGLRFLLRGMSEVDPHLFRAVDQHVAPGHTIWDVGANLGLFSFSSALKAGTAGRVYAIEPDAWLQELLRRSRRGLPNHSANVEVVPCAVGGNVGLRTFCLAKRSRSTNFLEGHGTAQTGGMLEQQTIMCVSIDWLATQLPPPNAIKIDVEGAELEVLQGARETLMKYRPIVMCEVQTDVEPVTEVFKELRYRLYDLDGVPGAPPIHTAAFNTLALPED